MVTPSLSLSVADSIVDEGMKHMGETVCVDLTSMVMWDRSNGYSVYRGERMTLEGTDHDGELILKLSSYLNQTFDAAHLAISIEHSSKADHYVLFISSFDHYGDSISARNATIQRNESIATRKPIDLAA